MKRSLLSGLLVAVVVAGPAAADRSSMRDPDDTPGRLDIKVVAQSHQSGGAGDLKHRVGMFHRWGKRHLRGSSNFINMFFTTDEDRGFERRLTIDVRNGKLYAQMDEYPSLKPVGRAQVWRPSRRGVAVAFPTNFLGENVKTYKWQANSFFHTSGDGPCGTPTDVSRTCTDRAPDRRRLEHQL